MKRSELKIREYSAPLTVLAAAVLGFSLICIVSAAALNSPGTTKEAMEPQDIVNSAFSNPINTAAALTAVEITAYIATPTETLQATPTIIPSETPTARTFITWTPTRIRRERDTPTSTRVPPTNTRIPPTNTRIPTLTFTPVPTDTNTPVPPTYTPVPDTDTPMPPTNTPVPDTSTPTPPPTDINTTVSDINPSPGP